MEIILKTIHFARNTAQAGMVVLLWCSEYLRDLVVRSAVSARTPIVFFGFLFFLLSIATPQQTMAASCSSAATGNWTATSTWGIGCGTGGTPQVPTAGDDVTILNTHNVTVASGVNASATAVTVNNGGTLTLTSTGGLTASGNFTNNGTVTGTGALNLTGSGVTIDGTGTLAGLTGTTTITNSKTISSGATLGFGGAIAVSSGTTTNNGSTTVIGNLSGGGAWTQGATSTLNFGGNTLSVATTSFTASTNTVNYTRAGTQTCKVTQYFNITMSGTSAKTCALTANVLGDVRMQGTATWTLGAALTINGQLYVQGGTITTGAFAFTVTGTTTISSGTFALSSNTGTKTLTGPVILTGGTLNGASTAINIAKGITNNGGSVSITGTVTVNTAGVSFNGNSTVAITTLTVTSPGTVTNNATTTVSGNLTGTGSWTQGAGSTLNAGGATTNAMAVTTTDFTATGNTVNYTRAGAQTCKVTQYYNLTFTGNNTKTCAITANVLGNVTMGGTGTWTLTATSTVNGQLYVQGGTITTGSSAFTVTGTTTITSGTSTITNNTGVKTFSGPVIVSGGVLNGASSALRIENGLAQSSTGVVSLTGTTTFQTNTAQTLSGILGFGSVVVNSGVTITNNATTTLAGALTLTGNWTNGAGSALNVAGSFSNAGTFTSNTATTTFNGATAQSLAGNMTGSSALGTVVFSGAGAKSFASSSASTTNFVISSGSGAVSAPTNLSISGSYNNGATFTAGTGTTTFNGTAVQTATGTMTGTSAFNNILITNGTATTTFGSALAATNFTARTLGTKLAFAGGTTTTFTNAIIVGSSTATTTVRSSVSGNQSIFSVTSSYNLTYIDVSDNNACGSVGGGIDVSTSIARDSGNNTCWTFAASSNVSISGVLYQSDRTTTATSGYAIRLAIATSSTPTVLSTTTTAGGVWSFDSLGTTVSAATSGTPYTIWLDGTSTKATTLLMGNASSSAQGVPLYMEHLVVNGSTTASAVNLQNFWAYDSTDDTDVLYTISGTTATTSADLYIRQGIFTPTATLNLLGDYTNNGTFTHASGTVRFLATTTTQWISGDLKGTSAFNDVYFGSTTPLSTLAKGYWSFDNSALTFSSATVGTSTDVSGHGNDGTLVNMSSTTDVVAGVSGSALYFDGNNNQVRVPAGSLNDLSTFTACAWVYPQSSSTATYPQIISTYNSAQTTGWDFYLPDSGTDFALGTSFMTSPSTFTFKEYDNAVPADTWTHVCVKQQGDALADIYLYVNGTKLTGNFTGSENGTRDSDAGNTFNIGMNAAGSYPFTGTIDEVMIFDEYLNDQTINEIYQRTNRGFFSQSKMLIGNASTTDFVNASGTIVTATSSLTVFGDYLNGGTLATGLLLGATSSLYMTGSGVTVSNTDLSSLAYSYPYRMVFSGSGSKDLVTPVVTSKFEVTSSSGEVLMPAGLIIGESYINNGSTSTFAGHRWSTTTAAGDNDTWYGVTFGDSRFVAVGEGPDRVMTSTDGTTWAAQTAAGNDDSWNSVAYGNGLFVAVSFSGDRVMTSPDGATWTVRSAAGNNDSWYGVSYGSGRFVAVGAGPDVAMYSLDGITWTAVSAAENDDVWNGVTYANGLFVAVGYSGDDRVMTSPDGVAWTTQSALGNDDGWLGVTYGNGRYVAVGSSGDDRVMTSPDGVTWTTRSAAENDDKWVSVVFGNGLFVAVGIATGDDRVITSPDGVTWTARSAAGDNDDWYGVTYGFDMFVAVSGSGDRVMTSTDSFLAIETTGDSTVSGNLTGASQLRSVNAASDSGTVTFANNASTTNLYISSTGSTTLPTAITVSGNLQNDGKIVAGSGTVYFDGVVPQSILGNLNANSTLTNIVLSGPGTKTFYNSASTTNLTIANYSGEVSMPAALTVSGNYTNNGTTTYAGGVWQTVSAAGDNDDWFGAVYASSTFIAVGGYGGDVVMTSPDGITWTARSAAGNNDVWGSVTYGAGKFVAVGSGPDVVMTSSNGITWATSSAAGNNDAWQDVTYGNGLFVAVGDSGDRVMTSPDGITWTARSAAGNDDSWNSVTYGNGLFVAVAESGTDIAMTSPDGITWTARSAAGNDDGWQYVTYGNGLFVAVGGFSSDVVMTSPDGITWTARSAAGNDDTWTSVVYGNGLFAAFGRDFGGADRVMTSPDGITWTARSAAGNNDLWYGAAYGNNRFVAVGSATGGKDAVITADDMTLYLAGTTNQTVSGSLTGASQLRTVTLSGAGSKTFSNNASTTNFTVLSSSGEVVLPTAMSMSGNYNNNSTTTAAGAVWTPVSVSGDNDAWTDVAYGNGTFVAISNSGVRVATSPDGLNWTAQTAAGDDDSWAGVTYGNGLFVAVGYGGDNRVMTSPDGITWTAQSAAGNDDLWSGVTYGNGRFVAVGVAPGDKIMTSPDGSTWTIQSGAGNDDYWTDVTYGNGLFVAVGDSTGSMDAVMTSPDGITWTVQSADGDDDYWVGTTYGNGLFVAVGFSGSRAMTSPDGITWTARSILGDNDSWSDVTYGNGLFVAVSFSGDRIATSPDGINWTARSAAGNNDDWYSVSYGNDRFVAVANAGTGERFMTAIDTTLYLSGVNPQTVSGTLWGASQLRSVILTEEGSKTFSNNASTTNFFVATSSSTTLPTALTIAGDYTNNGTVYTASGTVYLAGALPQTLRGTLTATSSFNNLTIKNNSRLGTTTFVSAVTVNGTLSADGGTYVAFPASATSTVATLTLRGSSTAPVALGSTATGTKMNFVLTGTPTVTYTTIFDSNACGSTGGVIDVSGGNNTDGGNTTCWNFTAPATASVALSSSQRFYVGQATTTLNTVTITDGTSPTITAANDIRLTIATTTTNFRFDVGVTTLTFGGTASGKVSNPVTYEDGGATLVIPVGTNFAASDTLTISGISVGAFNSVSSASSELGLQTDGNSTGTPADTSTETFTITGSLTIAEHAATQTSNKFSWQNQTGATLFAFKLTPTSENSTTTDLVITLSGVQGVESDDLSNLKLYVDGDSDGVYDTGETQVGGSGILTLNGQFGAITFSSDFLATTTRNYIVIGDTTTIAPGAAAVFSLPTTGVTATGATAGALTSVIGSVSNIQHIRNVAGGRGINASDRIGGDAPAGGGIQTGGGVGGGSEFGDTSSGDNISPDVEFVRPSGTSTPSEWTNPQNAYASDGTSATAATNAFRQTFINFNFGIPSSNSIQGIAVKLDASGSTAAGTLDVALSWDGGSSYTTAKATPTLSGSDVVYTVGGPADTWGRSWSVSEFSNANFRLRVTANTSSNTLRLDGLEIRIYHQASGGGSGGGGGI